MNKLVSVIIPTYSRPNYIERAIKSVKNQVYKPVEIIVVDDNGVGTNYQKETEYLLAPYIESGEIVYIAHDVNKNGAAARNTGFHAANGEYLTFLDDDDVILPEKISKQVYAIENSDENVAAAYCGCRVIRHGKVLMETRADLCGNFKNLMLQGKWGFGSGSNLLLKRKAVEKIEGYDETFSRRQDLEFTIRYFRYYNIVGVDEILLEKYNDAPTKRPNPRVYVQIEEQFLCAFKDDISLMSLKDAQMVYYSSYYKMALGAANARDIPFLYTMMKKCIGYKIPSIKDILRVIHNFISQPQIR